MPTYKTLVRSRAAAFARQGGVCHYCALPVWLDDLESFRARYGLTLADARRRKCTAEHLQARKDGGNDNPGNIVAACFACNVRRHRLKPAPSAERYGCYVRRRIALGRWHQPHVIKVLVAAPPM